MTCSIITITYNNLAGLRKTAESVAAQTYRDMEWVVVDGASTDGTQEWLDKMRQDSPDPLKEGDKDTGNAQCRGDNLQIHKYSNVQVLSEPDRGVYDAQNKGIGLAKGDFCFFLNAGDAFCGADVVARMMADSEGADIVYGNELVVDARGRVVEHCKGVDAPGFVDLYNSCMKHQATFIRRSLFDRYGNYDSTMRICADFDWFFRVIAFHDEVRLLYRDVDVAYFENTGLSYHSPDLCACERKQILDRLMPVRLQRDYEVIARYPRVTKLRNQCLPQFLLRMANKLLKSL